MGEIKKVLVANRGEIAIRVFRTCRELGIATVAVYSDADRASLHVRMADEAYRVGPAPSADSYLDIDAVIAAARKSGADAIHPGYGFLSENAGFAERCTKEGITFIGPPPTAIAAMGDKAAARKLMDAAGVPMAPGVVDPVETEDEAGRIAGEIGYPVLIKAAAGGGGKGMRVVREVGDLAASFASARREAESAFGDGRVYVEKYIDQPRHIEIQVLADQHGNVIHLGERECSIQRRHQKVIEESPSCYVDEELRNAMGAAAVEAARACGYVNAGTVEFLVDSDRRFYFMEMNTRLQVEHPVTEIVTGFDLVAEQIRVAEGSTLAVSQGEVQMTGHAIECRVYAEDPAANFLPDPGLLIRHRGPAGPRVRLDAGVEEGSEIPIHYDPMISKLVTWGPDRERAIETMLRALDEYVIAGVATTIPFCRLVLEHPDFRSGQFSTHFVQDVFDPASLASRTDQDLISNALAALLAKEAGTNGKAGEAAVTQR